MKTALFVLLDQYADWEGAHLMSLLNQRFDWQIQTTSNQTQVESIGGLRITIDLDFAQITNHVDLLVLIGSNSWNIYNSELFAIIERQFAHRLPIAAICDSVDFLARYGFLEGYKHTGNTSLLKQEYDRYLSPENFYRKPAVSDRNLVTANGTASLDFAEFTLQLIGDSLIEAKKEVDLYRLGYYGYQNKYGNISF